MFFLALCLRERCRIFYDLYADLPSAKRAGVSDAKVVAGFIGCGMRVVARGFSVRGTDVN